MLAVDTNVIVRFLARDEPKQSARAGEIIHANRIWIGKTVLLESEWVLRSVYSFSPNRIAEGLRALAGLPQIEIEDAAGVARALDWYQAGMDFADALHLASCSAADQFATFDRKFAAKAERLGAMRMLILG